MAEKPITDIGKVFKDKDGAYRIYIGKQIADAASFENKEKVFKEVNRFVKKWLKNQ